jgi:hypothetical protein
VDSDVRGQRTFAPPNVDGGTGVGENVGGRVTGAVLGGGVL